MFILHKDTKVDAEIFVISYTAQETNFRQDENSPRLAVWCLMQHPLTFPLWPLRPPGDIHWDPDGAPAPAVAADGVCADGSSADPGAGRADTVLAPLLQDPQQGAASARLPPHPPPGVRRRHPHHPNTDTHTQHRNTCPRQWGQAGKTPPPRHHQLTNGNLTVKMIRLWSLVVWP